jgi:asparagine synthase (glutamine-hydrolysing)
VCGIAGWVADGDGPTSGTLDEMLRAMAHRGPDDSGSTLLPCAHSARTVALGHRRLAIIDPTGARQPMTAGEAGLALVFNGEIYNFRELREELRRHGHRFALESDTEVLLRAYQHWGNDVVAHLRGMFAFAIWDAHNERLFLARDRFGEKPLFLYERGSDLYFASEIKALLCLPFVKTTVNLNAVWDYLAYRYVPGPATLFDGIRKLMPATAAEWADGRLTEWRYWTPPDGERRRPALAVGEPVAEFLTRLEEAVKLQMVSDVPFGAFLSGGIDSSVVVALMSRHTSTVNTFSAGFAEDAYNERSYALDVARRYATNHHETVVSPHDVTDRLSALVAQRDAPVTEPSDVAISMLAQEAARSVKMVLTGEGSDEVLGGYPKHVSERFASAYQCLPSVVRNGLVQPLVRALPQEFRRVKTAVASLSTPDSRERMVRWFGALDARERDRLSVLPRVNGGLHGVEFDADPRVGALRRTLYFDQTSWLPDNLLERADRMTMAASIEARLPFLDHRLVEFVASLPDRYRVRRLRGKWILREAARHLLPSEILWRPKIGFRVPVGEWFRGHLRDYLCEHLRSASSRTRAYYDTHALDETLDEHLAGRQNHEKLLWALLNLELWHRRYA